MAQPIPLVEPIQNTCTIKPIQETCSVEPEELIVNPVQPYKSKFKCDPCPCTTLGCGAYAVAIFTILVDIVVIVGFVVPLLIGDRRGTTRDDTYLIVDVAIIRSKPIQINHRLYIFIVQLLMAFASSIFAIFLCLGVRQLKRWLCGIYFVGTCMLEFLGVILILVEIWNGRLFRGYLRISNVILDLLPELFLFFINVYFLIVVFYFMKEINFNLPKPQPHLPEQHFQEGIVRPLPYQIGVVSQSGQVHASCSCGL